MRATNAAVPEMFEEMRVLPAGVSDAIPAAIGGIPADAPPRPGTAKYDEYMRERERKRLLPASERGEEAKPAPAAQNAAR